MPIRNLIIIVFSLVISLIDTKIYKIPNILLFSCLICLIFADIYARMGVDFYLKRTSIAFFWFAVFYMVFRLSGGLGFGDVKFAFVLGYALGAEKSITAFIFMGIGAIFVYAIGVIVFKWNKSAKLPFAPFMSFGVIVAEFFKISIL